jgi:hypothetical protein
MKFTVRAALAAAVGLVAAGAFAQSNTSFYIAAHEDDWQLFIGNEVYDDISAGKNVVIVYMTAGEGGLRTGGTGAIPYYRARELASYQSILIPTFLGNVSKTNDGWFTRTFNNKKIYANKERNVTSYYFRLPDGNPGGGGYEINNNESLGRLYVGNKPSIKSIDNSATYTGWGQLRATLEALIRYHVGNASGFRLATHLPDWTQNADDHSDHLHTGLLAKEAGHNTGAVMRGWFDYCINTKPSNLTPSDTMDKTRMQGALASILAANRYDPTVDSWHSSFLDRTYTVPLQ